MVLFRLLTAAALGSLACVGAAHAQQAPANPTSATDPFANAASLPASDLKGMSGGQQVVTIDVGSSQVLTATNSGNSVTGRTVDSGQVTLQQGAFDGYSGVGNFVINTGHNNNLQGSISLNIASVPGR